MFFLFSFEDEKFRLTYTLQFPKLKLLQVEEKYYQEKTGK